MIDKNKKPFEYVISRMDDIVIDDQLKPIFIRSMQLIQKYFEENDLIDSENFIDFAQFFDDYLIGPGKCEIRLYDRSDTHNNNCFNPTDNRIEILKDSCKMEIFNIHQFIHEFIHFIVHAQKIKAGKEQAENLNREEIFFDEGFTEKLAQDICGVKYTNTYQENLTIVELIQSMYGKSDAYRSFLSAENMNERYYDGDEYFLMATHDAYSRFYEWLELSIEELEASREGNENAQDVLRRLREEWLTKVQRGVIGKYNIQCNNIDEFVALAKAMANRPKQDINYMNDFYKELKTNLIRSLISRGTAKQEDIYTIMEGLDDIIELVDTMECSTDKKIGMLTLEAEDETEIDVYINPEGVIIGPKILEEEYSIKRNGEYHGYDHGYLLTSKFDNTKYKLLNVSHEEIEQMDFDSLYSKCSFDLATMIQIFHESERSGHSVAEMLEQLSAKKEIEDSIDGCTVSEMLRITDKRLNQYLSNSTKEKTSGHYLIEIEMQDGTKDYQFISIVPRLGYREQSSLRQVDCSQDYITVSDDYTAKSNRGNNSRQHTDTQFIDSTSTYSYFISHDENGIDLSYTRDSNPNSVKKRVSFEGSELSEIIHHVKFGQFIKNGYSYFGIGAKKVKEVTEAYKHTERTNQTKENR